MKDKLKKLQKEEAIKRLKILHNKYGLPANIIEAFSKNETVYYSEFECHKMQWTIQKISKDEYLENAIKEFEINNDVLVYYAIFEPSTNRGLELSMLYISEDKWNWENETKELLDGEPLVYEKNLDCDNESGFWYYKMQYISF